MASQYCLCSCHASSCQLLNEYFGVFTVHCLFCQVTPPVMMETENGKLEEELEQILSSSMTKMLDQASTQSPDVILNSITSTASVLDVIVS